MTPVSVKLLVVGTIQSFLKVSHLSPSGLTFFTLILQLIAQLLRPGQERGYLFLKEFLTLHEIFQNKLHRLTGQEFLLMLFSQILDKTVFLILRNLRYSLPLLNIGPPVSLPYGPAPGSSSSFGTTEGRYSSGSLPISGPGYQKVELSRPSHFLSTYLNDPLIPGLLDGLFNSSYFNGTLKPIYINYDLL